MTTRVVGHGGTPQVMVSKFVLTKFVLKGILDEYDSFSVKCQSHHHHHNNNNPKSVFVVTAMLC